jgi:hypothetical protein
MKQFSQARKYIIEIIEKGIKEHPGLLFNIFKKFGVIPHIPIRFDCHRFSPKTDFSFQTELGIGTNSDGVEGRSVGNTLTLKETALVEAFNLKAAIEYELKNCKSQDSSIYQCFEYLRSNSILFI